jgi:hypothetical protein
MPRDPWLSDRITVDYDYSRMHRPWTKLQWLTRFRDRNKLKEGCWTLSIDCLWLERDVVFCKANKREIASLFNWWFGVEFGRHHICSFLKKGLVLKEDLIPVFFCYFESNRALRMCWFQGIDIYFHPRCYFAGDDRLTLVERYLKCYEEFKCSMVVLKGLGLLPEHEREVMGFM